MSANATSVMEPAVGGAFDVESVRRDFPALDQQVHGQPLAYMDSAASGLKPQAVMDAVARTYGVDCANVHRGVHTLSQRATEAYEGARDKVRDFVGAAQREEIVFVRGATEGVNLVAQSFVRPGLQAGDEVVISAIEHHSNIVPWQMLCEQAGATLRVIPMNERGELRMESLDELLTERTKFVSVNYVSNALGTVNPVEEIIEKAHRREIPVMLDAAQAAPHMAMDVRALGCEFLTFSGHKVFGPTGIGALYGRRDLLEAMPPYQGGGDMILSVSFEKTEYNELPYRFEAGTPHIAGAIGLGAAIDYVTGIGMDRIAAYEDDLLAYGTEVLSAIDGLRLIGTAERKVAVFSFVLDGIHAADVGTILDHLGIAVRVGHHCAQPAIEAFGVPATARASLALYNTRDEIDRLAEAIRKTQEMFG